VHLLLDVPSDLASSRVMQAIKGKARPRITSCRIGASCARRSGARHLWARGYLVATSSNVTDEVIDEYIRLQGAEPQDEERFRITESEPASCGVGPLVDAKPSPLGQGPDRSLRRGCWRCRTNLNAWCSSSKRLAVSNESYRACSPTRGCAVDTQYETEFDTVLGDTVLLLSPDKRLS
jgi:Transposase IS200 like